MKFNQLDKQVWEVLVGVCVCGVEGGGATLICPAPIVYMVHTRRGGGGGGGLNRRFQLRYLPLN